MADPEGDEPVDLERLAQVRREINDATEEQLQADKRARLRRQREQMINGF